MKIAWFLFLLTAHAAAATPPDCETWYPPAGKLKGVMIVTHGLNLKAAALSEIAKHHAANGYEVLLPSFTGHCGPAETLQNVKPEEWESDARRFHAAAKEKAMKKKVPLVLSAYSFSGLVFQSLSRELPFDRRVYLAPALETHFWYPFVVFLVNLWPTNLPRTVIPEGYYAQEYAGTRSVLTMNHFFLKWNEQRKTEDPTPTLIWASLKDELVHGPRLKKLAEGKKGWKFREVSVSGATLKPSYDHLIVDSASLGQAEFSRMLVETGKFLEDN